jgi:hypothetical protein
MLVYEKNESWRERVAVALRATRNVRGNQNKEGTFKGCFGSQVTALVALCVRQQRQRAVACAHAALELKRLP